MYLRRYIFIRCFAFDLLTGLLNAAACIPNASHALSTEAVQLPKCSQLFPSFARTSIFFLRERVSLNMKCVGLHTWYKVSTVTIAILDLNRKCTGMFANLVQLSIEHPAALCQRSLAFPIFIHSHMPCFHPRCRKVCVRLLKICTWEYTAGLTPMMAMVVVI